MRCSASALLDSFVVCFPDELLLLHNLLRSYHLPILAAEFHDVGNVSKELPSRQGTRYFTDAAHKEKAGVNININTSDLCNKHNPVHTMPTGDGKLGSASRGSFSGFSTPGGMSISQSVLLAILKIGDSERAVHETLQHRDNNLNANAHFCLAPEQSPE